MRTKGFGYYVQIPTDWDIERFGGYKMVQKREELGFRCTRLGRHKP